MVLVMKVLLSSDLTDLIVYFDKCGHWSWYVRIYWWRMLHAVAPVYCELTNMNAVWSPTEPTNSNLVFHLGKCYSISLND